MSPRDFLWAVFQNSKEKDLCVFSWQVELHDIPERKENHGFSARRDHIDQPTSDCTDEANKLKRSYVSFPMGDQN